MKRLILFCFALILVFSISSCKKEENDSFDVTKDVVGEYIGTKDAFTANPQANYSLSITKTDNNTITVSPQSDASFTVNIRRLFGSVYNSDGTSAAAFDYNIDTRNVSIDRWDGTFNFEGAKQ